MRGTAVGRGGSCRSVKAGRKERRSDVSRLVISLIFRLVLLICDRVKKNGKNQ